MSAVAEQTPRSPTTRGRFGTYGGRYVPEVLIPALDELDAAWSELRDDPGFRAEFGDLLRDFVGRPTPITHARRLSEELGLRDLAEARGPGAHRRPQDQQRARAGAGREAAWARTRIIAETGAGPARRRGRHGLRAARTAVRRVHGRGGHASAGAERRADAAARRRGRAGHGREPDAEGGRERGAPRLGGERSSNTHYIIGSVVGPHPFPVARPRPAARDRRRGARAVRASGSAADPEVVVACVGGGSNAIGMFTAFVGAPGVRLIGVEAGGRGSQLGEHCSSITQGQPGILHGALSYLLQDADGQVADTHSISAGLDYPGVGPEHAYLRDAGLAEYVSRHRRRGARGVPGAGEDRGHPAGARAVPRDRMAAARGRCPQGSKVLVCLSGRGDKDLDTVLAALRAKDA